MKYYNTQGMQSHTHTTPITHFFGSQTALAPSRALRVLSAPFPAAGGLCCAALAPEAELVLFVFYF
jgi:hypothetical protein